MKCRDFLMQITRVKHQTEDDLQRTKLARVLTTLDLTMLGIGSTVGVGIYVLAGQVSKQLAGPAVIISFLIAAIGSALAGFCYAEFGARVPKAGSAYAYCYYTVGELFAFVIGWNLILEYLIGAASVSKGLSSYLDELTGNYISNTLRKIYTLDWGFLGEYPDLFAFSIVFLMAVILSLGVKQSSLMSSICTGINLSIVVFVIIAGSLKADPKNWKIKKDEIPEDVDGGEGGFMPYGVVGIIKGAAVCFYGFVGFDCIATAGEEAKSPKKSIPISIIVSLTVIFLAYFSMSTVLTLMVPYYDQNENAPFTVAFEKIGWTFAKWIVSIGAIFGLLPSLLGALLPLPRIIYALSTDGLLFGILGRVNERFHTPMIGTLFSGFLTGLMAMLFNLSQLVDMMSIGTLVAYNIVAACLLVLRYQKSDEDEPEENDEMWNWRKLGKQMFNRSRLKSPTRFSSNYVAFMVLLYCGLCYAIMSCFAFMLDPILSAQPIALAMCSVLAVLGIIILTSIGVQPKSKKMPYFTVPGVPFTPALSILINTYLTLMLNAATWIRFGIWIVIGMAIYLFYSYRNSEEGKRSKAEKKAANAPDQSQ